MTSGNKSLLIVDDETGVRALFREMFERFGWVVEEAEGAGDALEILKKEDDFVIFLDLKLFGTNGIELCRLIRKKKPLSIIYAITGWTSLFEVEECREAGFDDFFTKPLDFRILQKAVVEAHEKISRWRKPYGGGP